MDHLGIDVHKMESQLCIVGEEGQLSEPRIRTTPVRFAAVLGDRPRARILQATQSAIWRIDTKWTCSGNSPVLIGFAQWRSAR